MAMRRAALGAAHGGFYLGAILAALELRWDQRSGEALGVFVFAICETLSRAGFSVPN
jgi:hypothetical protein